MAPGGASASDIAGVLRMVFVHSKYRKCEYVFKSSKLIPQSGASSESRLKGIFFLFSFRSRTMEYARYWDGIGVRF